MEQDDMMLNIRTPNSTSSKPKPQQENKRSKYSVK